MDNASSPAAHNRDSLVRLWVTEDGLHAFADFLPSFGDGDPLTESYAANVLKVERIDYGIDHAAIAETVASCNAQHVPMMQVLVAAGRPPVRTNPARLVLVPRFQRAVEHYRAGNRNSPFAPKRGFALEIVQRGETIATMQEEVSGIDGVDVYNTPIPAGTLQVDGLVPGEGTREAAGCLRAERGGLLCMDDGNTVWVEDTIVLPEVGPDTGDIRFPGHAVIEHHVQDGRRLWIGGNAHVKSTLDAHEVFVRGALRVDAGIVGRGNALVRCGGDIVAGFIEHCRVETKSSVRVGRAVYNSRVMALGTVSLGDGATLIGGETRATAGIEASVVGNSAEVPTLLVAGADFVMERKLAYAQSKHRELTLLMQQLEEQADDPACPDEEAVLDRIAEIQEARAEHSSTVAEMLAYLDAEESAEIVVTSEVYPGTAIHICRAKHSVTEKLGPSRFYLDKEKGRIEREEL